MLRRLTEDLKFGVQGLRYGAGQELHPPDIARYLPAIRDEVDASTFRVQGQGSGVQGLEFRVSDASRELHRPNNPRRLKAVREKACA